LFIGLAEIDVELAKPVFIEFFQRFLVLTRMALMRAPSGASDRVVSGAKQPFREARNIHG
jgi:hypothetical protein